MQNGRKVMNQDEKYIRECLEIAKLAEGQVSPNPLVGSIILDKFGEIAGRGFHAKCGESHAEICALSEAGEKAKDGTLYVNLEPCSHFGKTPPCIDSVIKAGIKRLVIGMQDPNPLVSGKGIEKALKAGIEVKVGVLEKECKKFNEVFIKHITKKQPFIAIKSASTMDGRISTKTGSSKWITSESARFEVQKLRNKYDAILTGSGTVIKDNPKLTCRLKDRIILPSCFNEEKCAVNVYGRNPIRIIIDSRLETPPESFVYDNTSRIIIVTSNDIKDNKESKYPSHVEFLETPLINGRIDLSYMAWELYNRGIYSILVEAGGSLNGSFIKENLVDKFYFFIAPKLLGDKLAYSFVEGFNLNDINETINFKFGKIKTLPPDIMIEGYLE